MIGDACVYVLALVIRKRESITQVFDYNDHISFVKEFMKEAIGLHYPFLLSWREMGRVFWFGVGELVNAYNSDRTSN